jgi:signal transduction histidine kinase
MACGRFVGVAAAIALSALTSLACPAAPAPEPRRVLLLHSFGPQFAPWSMISAGLREQLNERSPYPIDLYEASLQTERFSLSGKPGPLLEYVSAMFSDRDPNLIIAMGAPAARFALLNRSRMFPSAPLLVTGADERTLRDAVLTAKDTAIAVAIEPEKQIESILQVLPETTTIAVVIGDSPLERFWVDELRLAFARFNDRVTFDWLNKLSFDEMIARVANLPPRSAIYYATIRMDARGVPHEEDRALMRLHELGTAPIFTYIDSYFGQGVVGGPMLSTQDVADRSAIVAARILGGEAPDTIKSPAIGLAQPTFDWRELSRWNIPEANLPKDSLVLFRASGLWAEYRAQVIAVFAAMLTQGALIGWLIFEHRRRHLAEVRSRNSMAQLAQMNRVSTVGELSASIAHEINQPLTGITTRASAALRWLSRDPPEFQKARDALSQIVAASSRTSEIVTSIRAMVGKAPDERADVDLNRIITTVLEIMRIELQRNEIDVALALDATLRKVRCSRVQIEQVVLNLIINAVEAMQSTRPRVLRISTATSGSDMARVSIEDSGPGIEPSHADQVFKALFTTKPGGIGIGLAICRSIVEGHGGRIWVSPAAHRGAVFHFELPLSAAQKSSGGT